MSDTVTTTVLAERPTDERLRVLLDKAEISELIDRYVVTLDTAERPDRDHDWFRAIFTDDVRLSFPIRQHTGVDGLPEFHRAARLTWQATTHLTGNHLITTNGDRAVVRVHVIGTHIEYGVPVDRVTQAHRFDMGGAYEASAVRTERGWRIDSLAFQLTWTAGDGVPTGEHP